MWSRRSAIEQCPSPWNRIRKCPTVTDNGLVKGTDILLIQIISSKNWKPVNIIALHWPVICYCWAFTYSVSRRRASLDRRSTTPHVFILRQMLQRPHFSTDLWDILEFYIIDPCKTFHLYEKICISKFLLIKLVKFLSR